MFYFNANHFSQWHLRPFYFTIYVGEPEATWAGIPQILVWSGAAKTLTWTA